MVSRTAWRPRVLVNFVPPTGVEYVRVLPEIILTVIGTLIMLLDPLTGEGDKSFFGHLSIAGLVAALWGAVLAYANPGTAFSNMLIVDGFATFFRVLVIGTGIITVLCSYQYLRRERANASEYFALLLFSIAGQCIMASANELIMIFLGLEISSIATYVLAGYLRDDKRNNEAALKYFLLGSFATAFLLYGIAWIYGATGFTNLSQIRLALTSPDSAPSLELVGISAALMFVGFAFKVSAAPFQIWAPDVYQGAPAPVAAFMTVAPKAAAFAVFLRVYMTAFGPVTARWEPIVWSSALLTMIVGNFAALSQTNIKRLLGYSAIAHAGYVMVAVAAHSQVGTAAAMFYLAAYGLTNLGAFAVVTYFVRQGEKFTDVQDLAGLGWKQPMTAALFSIFLLSLIGVPLTGGFFGKFYIFKAALDAKHVWLAIIGLLNSAVAAYYYLRILVVMYMDEPGETTESLPPPGAGIQTALWVTALGTLLLGIFPSVVLDFARNSSNLTK
jgi:NADH-quinone oxidoreductase subunit N